MDFFKIKLVVEVYNKKYNIKSSSFNFYSLSSIQRLFLNPSRFAY